MPWKYQKDSKRRRESDVQTALNIINEGKSILSTADYFVFQNQCFGNE